MAEQEKTRLTIALAATLALSIFVNIVLVIKIIALQGAISAAPVVLNFQTPAAKTAAAQNKPPNGK